MKRLISTAVLLVVVIAAYFYLEQNDFFSKKEETKEALITFDVSKVVDIQIQTLEEKIELQRPAPNQMWKFVGSEPYPTRSEPVEYWLADFNRLENIGAVSDGDEDLGQYGLQRPTSSFRVQLADGNVHTLLLGDTLPVGTSTYAKWAEKSGVFKLTLADVQRLQKPAFEFVDKRPFHVDFDRVVRLSMNYRGIEWTLIKKTDPAEILDSKWELNGTETNYYRAADAISPYAFFKTEQPLQKISLTKEESNDFYLEIEQVSEGSKGTSDRSKTEVAKHYGKVNGDQMVIHQENGTYQFVIMATAVKEAAEAPLKEKK